MIVTVKDLMENLSKCNPDAKLQIIQEEELECMPELWDDEEQRVGGIANELYCEDLHSHGMYLLAVDK